MVSVEVSWKHPRKVISIENRFLDSGWRHRLRSIWMHNAAPGHLQFLCKQLSIGSGTLVPCLSPRPARPPRPPVEVKVRKVPPLRVGKAPFWKWGKAPFESESKKSSPIESGKSSLLKVGKSSLWKWKWEKLPSENEGGREAHQL